MNKHDHRDELSGINDRLNRLGRDYPYPPTPDIAAVLAGKRWSVPRQVFPIRRALALVAFLITVLIISVPPVRAAVADFFQLGRIRIYFETEVLPGLTPNVIPLTTPTVFTSLEAKPAAPSQEGDSGTELMGLISLVGEKTVAEARAGFPYPSPLPVYPPDLGPPDRAYLQENGGALLLFVWDDPVDANRVKLSLLILGPGASVGKGAPEVFFETVVDEAPAVWLEGDHYLVLETTGGIQPVVLMVEANVLIWDYQELTYRLEGNLDLGEMVKIAESLE